jgi:hypothetical protein
MKTNNEMIKFLKNLKKYDIVTKENLISDKFIYAKSGLYVKQFNPEYDLYIEGNSKIVGNLEIDGNLVLNQGVELKQESNFISLNHNPDHKLSGIFFNQENIGLFYEDENKILSFGKMITNQTIEPYSFAINNIKINSLSFGNNIISSENGAIVISTNLSVNNELFINNLPIKTDNNYININNLKCTELFSNEIKSDLINSKKIQGDITNFIESFTEKHTSQNSLINNLYITNELVFDNECNIIFQSLKTIDNLSVNFVNNKKVDENGEILTTEGNQVISNKKFADNLDMNQNRITNLHLPEESSDVATKEYVDNLACGITHYTPIQAATTRSLDGTYLKSRQQFMANIPEFLVIDGHDTLVIGDRVLVKDQENIEENGIYFVAAKGDSKQLWILVLDQDYETIANSKHRISLSTYCENGFINEGYSFSMSNQYGSEIIINRINNSSIIKIKELEAKIEDLKNQMILMCRSNEIRY